MTVPYQQVSRDAQVALQEFSEEFIGALAQSDVEQWAKDAGFVIPTRAIKTTFPVAISAAGYKEFKGDVKYRSLFEKSFELLPKTWQDGVSELASIIEAPDFIGFLSEPERIAQAANSLFNERIAELLEANGTIWDGKAFFASDHPINVLDVPAGTFDNDITGAGTDPTIANLEIAKTNFRSIKAPNGKPAGYRMTHVLVPSAQEETWKTLLEQDMLIQSLDAGSTFGAVPNRHKGTVGLIISDELEDDLQWYPLALNKPGVHPWVLQDGGAPEELLSDKSSHLYKTTLKVGVAYVLLANGALAIPQCIQRWAGTAP